MAQPLTKKEIQVLNDIGNIKATLKTFSSVELVNDFDNGNMYEAVVRQINHQEGIGLRKAGLTVYSIHALPQNTISVKIVTRGFKI